MGVVGGQNGGVRTVDQPRSGQQYKLPVSTLERLSHPVSQTGPFVIVGPTVPAQQKSRFLAITFEQTLLAKSTNQKPLKCHLISVGTLLLLRR